MSIIDDSIIQDFEEYSFWIKANLRDYEYNEWTIKNVKGLKRILQIMCEIYSTHKVIDKSITEEFVYFPYTIFQCQYNIKDRKKELENIAYEFFKLQKQILDDTYEFVINEKEELYYAKQYDQMLELEVECWKTSLGREGFVKIYEKTKEFDFYVYDIFFNKLKSIIKVSSEINIFSKNVVRILCGVYSFFYKLIENTPSLGEIESAYLQFIDIPLS